jgi:hypothetical protein
MFYVIFRKYDGKGKRVVGGFIVDGNEDPIPFETEAEAKKAMTGHLLEDYSEVIEL